MARKKKPGPKPKKISREGVRKLARLGCTQDEIAEYFGVDQATISRRFASEITVARASCKLSIRRAQILCGTRKLNPQMLIHLGKHFLGQSDKQEVSGLDALFDEVNPDPDREAEARPDDAPLPE